MSEERRQIRPRLPDFATWVVEELVGIIENDPTAATRWIIVQWIKDNEEWLAGKRITYERFYEETKGSGPTGTVSPMKPGRRKKGQETGEEVDSNGEANGA
jgi:hypothetical protein